MINKNLNNIFLSPHNDDICFSIGSLVHSLKSGHLINIFTISKYLINQNYKNKINNNAVKQITNIRNKEDIKFAKFCKLKRHDLKIKDTSVTGIGDCSKKKLKFQIALLEKKLIPLLFKLYDKDKINIIYCPMAIGGHENHMSTLITMTKNFKIFEKKMNFLFYFDLPYSSNEKIRKMYFLEFKMNTKKKKYLIQKKKVDNIKKKLLMLRFYKSQHLIYPEVEKYLIKKNFKYYEYICKTF
jgi:hypothetical protein